MTINYKLNRNIKQILNGISLSNRKMSWEIDIDIINNNKNIINDI